MMKEANTIKHSTVNINNILSWVSYINPIENESEYVIIFIPGNPGIIEFYDRFLEEIYKRCQIPVFGLSYPGHNSSQTALVRRVCKALYKESRCNCVFTLEEQIQHKLDFIDQYIDSNKKVILLAHSLGSYITLNVIERMKITNQLTHVVLMFPVFERTMESDIGAKSVGRVKLLFTPMLMVNMIPKSVTTSVVDFIAKKRDLSGEDKHSLSTAIHSIVDPNTLRNIHQIADDLSKIGILDNLKDVIESNVKNITFYYGAHDGWTPNHFIEDMRKRFPSADIQKDTNNIGHAFVLEHSVLMAEIVAGILAPKLNLSKKSRTNDLVCINNNCDTWHVEVTRS